MTKKRIISAAAVLAAAVVSGLLCGREYYAERFYENTEINGKDCSGMTKEEAEELVEAEEYTLSVSAGETSFSITGEEVSLILDAEKGIEEVFKEQHESSYIKSLLGEESEYSASLKTSFDEKAVKKILKASEAYKGSEAYEVKEAEDAKIVWNGEKFEAEDGEAGNAINAKKAAAVLCEAVENLEENVDFTKEDVYKNARVTAEDLEETCEEMNGYALHWLSFEMYDGTAEELGAEDIKEWVSCGENGAVLDEEAVSEWVEDLCLSYKTVEGTRKFTTHDGETIKISGGDYGWRVDYDALCESVLEAIKNADTNAVSAYAKEQTDEAKKALTEAVEVTYTDEGQSGSKETDWDTENYSEVDISEQKVYVYKNGKLAHSCICVTGMPTSSRETTQGTWYVKDKRSTYTMTSEQWGYTVDTKWWTRITWSGIGYHTNSRNWSAWTPSLYKTDGSHGCVNLQEADAKTIYETVEIGDAVFIHE